MSVAQPSRLVRFLRVLKSLFIAEPHIVLPSGHPAMASSTNSAPKIEVTEAVRSTASSISAPPKVIEPAGTFALAGRLAAVAKLNVASARKPKRRNILATPGRAIPTTPRATIYTRTSLRPAAARPMTRIIKPGRRDTAVVIYIEAARPTQLVPAKRAA